MRLKVFQLMSIVSNGRIQPTERKKIPYQSSLSGHYLGLRVLGGMEAWETIKPSVNKKFVELYLAHELSSKEFNRLYGEDMKRLGLKD